jgi:hypothetical protein
MEWKPDLGACVTAMRWVQAGLVGQLGGPTGASSVGCAELGSKGLPVGATMTVHMRTALSGWEETEPSRYFCAEAGLGASLELRHRVWSVRGDGAAEAVEVLLPALALARALFRPHGRVLGRMFRPQALDSVSRMLDGRPQPVHRKTEAKASSATQPFLGVMTWLHCFPSAREAATSLYEHARAGWLAMDLPRAEVEVKVSGVLVGSQLFATAMALVSIRPQEAPFEFAPALGTEILCTSAKPVIQMARLPCRNGISHCSDEEWFAVAPILEQRSWHNAKHSAREVFDAALGVAGGTATSILSQVVDKAVSRLYRKRLDYWRENGSLTRAVDVVARMRGGVPADEPEPMVRRKLAGDLNLAHTR